MTCILSDFISFVVQYIEEESKDQVQLVMLTQDQQARILYQPDLLVGLPTNDWGDLPQRPQFSYEPNEAIFNP